MSFRLSQFSVRERTRDIVGLAVGMGACLLMMVYVVNETRYEDFHMHGDRIYRIALE
jgi:hypothetical protein